MIWSNLGIITGVIWALVMFGYFYNLLVAWLEKKGYTEGYMSLVVAFGVLVTLIGAAIIDWQAALWVLICFAASGAPMIIGSIVRYIRKREQTKKEIKKEVIQ